MSIRTFALVPAAVTASAAVDLEITPAEVDRALAIARLGDNTVSHAAVDRMLAPWRIRMSIVRALG